MAEYDRYENEGGGGFMMGLLTGTVIGAGLGMLLAPKAGSDLRGQVAEQARNFGTKANEQWSKASEAATGWAEKGRDMVSQARDAVNRGAEEARGYAGGTTGSSYNTGSTGSGYNSGTSGFGDRSTTGGGTDYGRS
jgi:gas vesicle protein